jgi:hypothetical protein
MYMLEGHVDCEVQGCLVVRLETKQIGREYIPHLRLSNSLARATAYSPFLHNWKQTKFAAAGIRARVS